MRNIILGTTCAALLSLSAVSPAMAEERNTNNAWVPLLLGGLAIYAIKDRNDRKRERARVETPVRPVRPVQPTRPAVIHTPRNVLPAACFRRVDTWDGRVGLFGKRCLERRYAHIDSLPRQCRTRLESDRGEVRRGFSARCLRHYGYRMSSR